MRISIMIITTTYSNFFQSQYSTECFLIASIGVIVVVDLDFIAIPIAIIINPTLIIPATAILKLVIARLRPDNQLNCDWKLDSEYVSHR